MSFDTLIQRVTEIKKIINMAKQANALPDKAAQRANGLRVDPYVSNDTAYHEAFSACRKKFAAEEVRQAEIARDRELKRLSVELDKLREDLPQIASDARFDLLDYSLSWRVGQSS